MPLCLKRTLSELVHFSLLGIIAIFYIIIVVIIQTPSYIQYKIDNGDYWEEFNWFTFSWSLFTGFASTIFAFACHTSIFMARSELAKPIEKRLKKLFFLTNLINGTFYAFASVFGYISFLDNTEALVIEREKLPGSSDYMMLIGKVVILLDMTGSYLMSQAPCRAQIFSFMGIERETK